MSTSLYQTKDLTLAASLYSHGYPLDKIEKETPDSKRVLFYFHETQQLKDFVNMFIQDSVAVDPIAFHFSLNKLKKKMRMFS